MAVADSTDFPAVAAATARSARSAVRSAADQVVPALEALCDALGPGGRVPTHTELMRRFGASERAVREALDRLQRSGRLVRRQGSGTYVADSAAAAAAPPHPVHGLAPRADTRAIVAVALTDHSFFERSLDLFCHHAETADLSPICKPVRDTREETLAALGRTLAATLADRFLVLGAPLEPLAQQLQESGARVVFFGTPAVDVTTAPFPWVCGDQEYGGYLVTSHLIELGHRRLAFVYFDGAARLANNRRWVGHRRALDEARRRGIALQDTVLERDAEAWLFDPAQVAARLRADDAPTALVCWNDNEATRLLPALQRAGIDVPGEVSVAGYDALPEGTLVYPPLTTVDPAAGQQIRFAVDLLTRDEPAQSAFTVFAPTLVVRGSTAPPPTVSD